MADKKEEVLTMMRHSARAMTVEEYKSRLQELQPAQIGPGRRVRTSGIGLQTLG